MSPDRVLAIVMAEILKLQSRAPARLGWIVLASLGLVVPLFLTFLGSSGVSVNGGDLGASLDISAANGARWALILRNFYVAQTFLIVLAAMSVAGEFQARTLREDLVRPVPRSVVLAAKWVALAVWSGSALAAQWVVAVAVGLVALGNNGDAEWSAVLAAYVASWLCDIGFAAVVLLVSAGARSVPGTIAGMFLFLVLERFVAWGLWVVNNIRVGMPPDWGEQVPWALDGLLQAAPFLPSSAWGVWREIADATDPTWQSWVALAALTAAAFTVAQILFARADVP